MLLKIQLNSEPSSDVTEDTTLESDTSAVVKVWIISKFKASAATPSISTSFPRQVTISDADDLSNLEFRYFKICTLLPECSSNLSFIE